jgi:hypothetical protein
VGVEGVGADMVGARGFSGNVVVDVEGAGADMVGA